ncbi:MAG: alkaline phosphatase family protein [Cyclobacteriaceae bacterium]
MKKIATICLIFVAAIAVNAQSKNYFPERPKIVVGIVVDQMRQEYLYRFAPKFGDGGFKRLMGEGFMLTNAHYNYVPTYTGPGHASIYTGATPAIHGIIANDWYDKNLKIKVNCVLDENQSIVGSDVGRGKVSPHRLLTTTITDELEMATQRRAKVVGISIKDRGAVLPAGHTPDGAYWYDDLTGKFISSTYYKMALPLWLDQFNSRNLADKYLNETWNTVYPIETYKESGPDDSPYESVLTDEWKVQGKDRPVFPYNLKLLRKDNKEFALLPFTPFGNDLLSDLAFAALDGEQMGRDEWTDFLSISFSSTDKLGHSVGPNAIELEDMYIRLDKNLEDILNKLDMDIGKGQYVVFLTADHGVADVRQYLKDLRIIPDSYKPINFLEGLNSYLDQYFAGKRIVENVSNEQVFLNHDVFTEDPKSSSVEYLVACELIRTYLLSLDGVSEVYTKSAIQNGSFDEDGLRGKVKRGYHTKRSGDIGFVMESGWTDDKDRSTGHSTGYTYDTHSPIIFYGFGVRHGSTANYHTITDIAPTLSTILKIKFPSGATGQPITELLKDIE